MSWEEMPVVRALLNVAGMGRAEWDGPQSSWSSAASDPDDTDRTDSEDAAAVPGLE